jgi:hypothetical protein
MSKADCRDGRWFDTCERTNSESWSLRACGFTRPQTGRPVNPERRVQGCVLMLFGADVRIPFDLTKISIDHQT